MNYISRLTSRKLCSFGAKIIYVVVTALNLFVDKNNWNFINCELTARNFTN